MSAIVKCSVLERNIRSTDKPSVHFCHLNFYPIGKIPVGFKINELNRKINYPPGERVEHNTVKLMYRYAQRENAPFDYVELVFSEYTKTPLLFKINFKIDETGIVETLKTKYGPPQVIDWKEENGKSMVWRKNLDLLLVSLVPDQFGHHEYQIVIYFMRNLKQLIEIEKIELKKREQQRAKSGERAF